MTLDNMRTMKNADQILSCPLMDAVLSVIKGEVAKEKGTHVTPVSEQREVFRAN